MRRPLRAEPEAAVGHVGLEDRLEDDLEGGLDDAVADGRDRERALLVPTGLWDVDPPGRDGLEPLLSQLCFQFAEQPVNPVLLDVGDGGLVDAWCAGIAAHLRPRPLQDVPAVDLVVERVEPSSGIGLGRTVKLALQGTDRVEGLLDAQGGTSLLGTHRPLLLARAWTKQRRFPSPAGVLSVRLDRYYHRLRRPVGRRPFPLSGYRTPRSGGLRSRRASEGLHSSRRHLPNVPRPLRRGVPRGCDPGSSPLPWPSP